MLVDFENSVYKDEIQGLLERTKPVLVKELRLTKIEADISCAAYNFYFENQYQEESCIYLTTYCSDICCVLEFLWETIHITKPICAIIEDEGQNGIFYARPLDNNQIHFFVADDYELYNKFCQEIIADYSFEDAHICIDVIIDKDVFVKQFYNKLWNEIKDWKIFFIREFGSFYHFNLKCLTERIEKLPLNFRKIEIFKIFCPTFSIYFDKLY